MQVGYNRTYISAALLLIGYLFLPFFSIGQEYSYSNYDSKDGLAGSTVYCTQQDKDGFLWFGTETGLSRFDGTHFKNFTTADGLPDNEILRLFVDSKNRVWILPFKNSICYYWKGRIHNKNNDSILKKIPIASHIRAVAEDREGNILIQENFVYHIIKPDGTMISEDKINGLSFYVTEVGLNARGNFRLLVSFIGRPFGDIVDLHETKVTFSQVVSVGWPEGNASVLSPNLNVVRDKKGWLVFYPAGRDSFSVPVPKNFINIFRINDTLLAINATGRCMFFDLMRKKITHEFLPGYRVTAVLQDREKNFWFTTMGEGVFRLGSVEFRNVRFKDNQSFVSVYSLLPTESGVYVGTDNSLLWKYNRLSNQVSKVKVGAYVEQGRVVSLVADKQKGFFIGTDNGVYDSTRYSEQMSQVPLSIKGIVFYKGSLIVATAQGIFKIDRYSNELIWRQRATCVLPGGNGLYIGTLNGLYEFDGEKSMNLGERHNSLSNRISAIAKADDGTYWIATYGEGLLGYKDNRIVANIREKNGLTSNICRNIMISENSLWIGTDKGLNKVNIKGSSYDIIKFTTADGLSSNIINAVSVDSGIVYVGTPRGLTYFNENNISQNSECLLSITGITVSDKTWNYDTTGLQLENADNNIRFDFAGISYKSAGDITYRYRLLGLDSNWKTGTENFLSYPSLPSGNYELQLVAINKFGIKSARKDIHFTIEQRLEEKTWFRVLLLLTIVGIASLLVRSYIKKIRRNEKAKTSTLRKMAELEQMALRAQMNPHFIFNSLNSIQQYVIDKDVAGANKFITDFSSLIRQTLEFSSKQEISLAEEISYLGTYMELERTRMENKFVYEISICDQIDPQDHYIPSMILQPFVENSIRHGIAYRKDTLGKIMVQVRLENSSLVCIVEDNGVGRSVANQYKNTRPFNHQSRGMAVTMARIEMLNKNNKYKITIAVHDLQDELGAAIGTRVTIDFPFDNVDNNRI